MSALTRLAICCCIGSALGCAKAGDEADVDTAATAAAMPEPASPPATISLADVAGKWQVRATPESGSDTSTTLYVLNATGDTSGWTITFPNRLVVPLRVEVNGDSIISLAGPFQSVRRKGVQVTTNNVLRLQDGRLVGTTVARYTTRGPDSVLRLRTEGTRAP